MEQSKIAVFDFDGTLTRCDSFVRFALFARGRRRFVRALLLGAPYLAAWKLRLIPGGQAKERLFALLFKGMQASDFHAAGRRFAHTLNLYVRPDMLNTLHRHLADGCRIYIVTASMAAWVGPWAETIGVAQSHVLGTEAETDADGRLTGRFAGANCVGTEKVRRLASAIPGLDPSRPGCIAYAYGNSPSDDGPLLAIAAHPLLLR